MKSPYTPTVFYLSVFEGPPPSTCYLLYAVTDPITQEEFTFSPVGCRDTRTSFTFRTREQAESFAADIFPGVPCNFVSWVSIRMLAAISTGAM